MLLTWPGLEMGPGAGWRGDSSFEPVSEAQNHGLPVPPGSGHGFKLSEDKRVLMEPPGPGLTCWGFGAWCWGPPPQGSAGS